MSVTMTRKKGPRRSPPDDPHVGSSSMPFKAANAGISHKQGRLRAAFCFGKEKARR